METDRRSTARIGTRAAAAESIVEQEQLLALQARLRELHVGEHLNSTELDELEDLVADYIELVRRPLLLLVLVLLLLLLLPSSTLPPCSQLTTHVY